MTQPSSPCVIPHPLDVALVTAPPVSPATNAEVASNPYGVGTMSDLMKLIFTGQQEKKVATECAQLLVAQQIDFDTIGYVDAGARSLVFQTVSIIAACPRVIIRLMKEADYKEAKLASEPMLKIMSWLAAFAALSSATSNQKPKRKREASKDKDETKNGGAKDEEPSNADNKRVGSNSKRKKHHPPANPEELPLLSLNDLLAELRKRAFATSRRKFRLSDLWREMSRRIALYDPFVIKRLWAAFEDHTYCSPHSSIRTALYVARLAVDDATENLSSHLFNWILSCGAGAMNLLDNYLFAFCEDPFKYRPLMPRLWDIFCKLTATPHKVSGAWFMYVHSAMWSIRLVSHSLLLSCTGL
jgi:hypothetical protein